MSFKISKKVNDKSMNKLTTFKFITYNSKMSVNNMINLMWLEFLYLGISNFVVQIINWIYVLSIETKWVPQQDQKAKNSPQDDEYIASHSDDEIMKGKT